MKVKRYLKILIVALVCLSIGTALVLPAGAVSNVTLKMLKTSITGVKNWVKRYFWTKGKADSRYVNVSGNDSVSGALTVGALNLSSAKTSYVSIPAASFTAATSGTAYHTPTLVYHPSSGELVAGVNLPNGVTVTQVTYFYYDQSGDNSTISLRRVDHSGYPSEIAAISSIGSAGWGSSSDDIISNPVIDNNSYCYFANLTGAGTLNNSAMGLRIKYTYNSL